eukprot:gnl/TRDRNA2_/TRDRNA2_43912_c0_seq1.p1 gnl/TRDRNA2_/TRDRNA2_43912_c0~~gnl/TRDRNA2_/TRDRNA2_43912_c0_seq1.p1  ORF type:complete len:178 (+),score=26.41 gnl/TRDRNA2_/TRDRNA2_43912_c0_seq1:132-665(+)
MAGHGYLAVGALSLLPAMFLIAYIGMHPRFKKDMSKIELARTWACIGIAFAFPFTCGVVGRRKDQTSAAQLKLESEVAGSSGRDYGFLLVQLHICLLGLSLLWWQRGAAEADPVPPTQMPFFGARYVGHANRVIFAAERNRDATAASYALDAARRRQTATQVGKKLSSSLAAGQLLQ